MRGSDGAVPFEHENDVDRSIDDRLEGNVEIVRRCLPSLRLFHERDASGAASSRRVLALGYATHKAGHNRPHGRSAATTHTDLSPCRNPTRCTVTQQQICHRYQRI